MKNIINMQFNINAREDHVLHKMQKHMTFKTMKTNFQYPASLELKIPHVFKYKERIISISN